MSESVEFTVVRHGETEGNLACLFQGHSDSPLSRRGLQQAMAVAERLRDEKFAAAYSSDLGRARDTARLIAAYHQDLEVHVDPALREWHVGELESRPQRELLREKQEMMLAFRYELETVCAPGGESRQEFQARVESFMALLVHRHLGQRVLLVTHTGVLQRLLRMVVGPTGRGNMLSHPDNASINILKYHYPAGEWQLVSWNCQEHLHRIGKHDTLLLD